MKLFLSVLAMVPLSHAVLASVSCCFNVLINSLLDPGNLRTTAGGKIRASLQTFGDVMLTDEMMSTNNRVKCLQLILLWKYHHHITSSGTSFGKLYRYRPLLGVMNHFYWSFTVCSYPKQNTICVAGTLLWHLLRCGGLVNIFVIYSSR